MTKNPIFVPGVPGLCRALCRVFRSCAGCAGSPTYARTRKNSAATTPHKRTHARIYTRHTRHTRHMLDSYTFFHTSPGTAPGSPRTDTPALAPDSLIYSFKGKKMEETPKPAATRTIRCTPDNAAHMQRLVKNSPAMLALVQHLQAADLFPGLRGLSVTLRGPHSFVDGGLGAVEQLMASKRD